MLGIFMEMMEKAKVHPPAMAWLASLDFTSPFSLRDQLVSWDRIEAVRKAPERNACFLRRDG